MKFDKETPKLSESYNEMQCCWPWNTGLREGFAKSPTTATCRGPVCALDASAEHPEESLCQVTAPVEARLDVILLTGFTQDSGTISQVTQ